MSVKWFSIFLHVYSAARLALEHLPTANGNAIDALLFMVESLLGQNHNAVLRADSGQMHIQLSMTE